jgi:hypothetical protein
MTDEVFDVDSYLRDFGRLTYEPLNEPNATLTLLPDLQPSGVDPFNKVPREMLPRMVGPSFAWNSRVERALLAKTILESEIVYDETGTVEDLDDIAAVAWDRLHAAYLVNEIAPDKEITIVTPIRRDPERRDRHLSVLEALAALEFDDDERRTITAREWLEELMPIARMHFSFFTNMSILGKDLYDGCLRPANLDEFMGLLSANVRSEARKQAGKARSSIDVFHPNCIDFVGAFAGSTDEQRRTLFHQFVKATDMDDVRPTLGSRFISGYKSAEGGLLREISHPVEYVSLLLGRGFIAPDLTRKTFDITPGGQAVIDTLHRCPDIVAYHTLLTEISTETRPMTDANGIEPWLMEYFEALKLATASSSES